MHKPSSNSTSGNSYLDFCLIVGGDSESDLMVIDGEGPIQSVIMQMITKIAEDQRQKIQIN